MNMAVLGRSGRWSERMLGQPALPGRLPDRRAVGFGGVHCCGTRSRSRRAPRGQYFGVSGIFLGYLLRDKGSIPTRCCTSCATARSPSSDTTCSTGSRTKTRTWPRMWAASGRDLVRSADGPRDRGGDDRRRSTGSAPPTPPPRRAGRAPGRPAVAGGRSGRRERPWISRPRERTSTKKANARPANSRSSNDEQERNDQRLELAHVIDEQVVAPCAHASFGAWPADGACLPKRAASLRPSGNMFTPAPRPFRAWPRRCAPTTRRRRRRHSRTNRDRRTLQEDHGRERRTRAPPPGPESCHRRRTPSSSETRRTHPSPPSSRRRGGPGRRAVCCEPAP